MKNLLLAVGMLSLASCSKNASVNEAGDPTRAAVGAYLQKTLDDPSSYQSVRWGKEKPFRQRDLDIERAADLLSEALSQTKLGTQASEHYVRMSDLSSTPKQGLAELDKAERVMAVYKHRSDSVKALSDKLLASHDTTELGTTVVHAFRAKNKMGALVLDSAVFTVLKSGKVEVQKF